MDLKSTTQHLTKIKNMLNSNILLSTNRFLNNWLIALIISISLQFVGYAAADGMPTQITTEPNTSNENSTKASDDIKSSEKNIIATDKQTSTSKTITEKKKKKPIKPEIKTAEEPQNTDEATKIQTGPPYPFIYNNQDTDQLDCKVTTFIAPEYPSKKTIKKSNNLMRKPGGPSRAGGNYVQIKGLVVDENCLPIQGTVIEIWQTDTTGKYEWEYDVKSHWEPEIAGRDNNFLFSGMAQTDNLGQFNFLTIFPGSKDENAPYINVIAKRTGYEDLHTRMYFGGHPRNDNDEFIKSLPEDSKNALIAPGKNIDPKEQHEGRAYYFPITMRGINGYKRF